MTMSIDAVTLDADLRWVEQAKGARVAGVETETLGGTVNRQWRALPDTGHLMTLEGDERVGWNKQSTWQALRTAFDAVPSTVVVVIDSDTYSCAVRFSQNGGLSQPKRRSGDFVSGITTDHWCTFTVYLLVLSGPT